MIAMTNNNIEKFAKIKEDGEPAKTNKRRYQRRGKPPYSYVALVAMCIQSSPNKRLRLREILKNIESMFPFFQGDYKGWRDSVRHNLTQNGCFKQILRDPTKPNGKGNYWTVVVDEIPGEMYKRQNTSVAYQAPEGKTYAADLREVYDFYSGKSKVSPTGSSIFEHTILQDLNASPPKISQPSYNQIRYQHQAPPQPQQYQHPIKFQQYQPFTTMDPFFNQQKFNQFHDAAFNQLQYANCFDMRPVGNGSGSLPHSPSSTSSPHSSITGVEFDWSADKTKSSSESGSPVKSVDSVPSLKRERVDSEAESEELQKLKKCRQELTADYMPKSSLTCFKDLDRFPAPNQVVSAPKEDDPFARRGLRSKRTSPPIKSVKSSQHKHSIRNILNLDELDGADGPQVLDPEQNPEALVRSGAFARLSKPILPSVASNYAHSQYIYHQPPPIFQPFSTFSNFDHFLK